MFCAANQGLGTCWINSGLSITAKKPLKTLSITDDLTIVVPIILGYPAEIPDMPKRTAPEIVSFR
ncbi:MAG: hypothetical protein MJB14_18155 [Spirochaetes bacterium]|nr:hypothetical protein [Spirochaetota bacterium]